MNHNQILKCPKMPTPNANIFDVTLAAHHLINFNIT